jgi:hypothetical protein
MRGSCLLPLCLLLAASAAAAACTVDANVGALPAHSTDGGPDADRLDGAPTTDAPPTGDDGQTPDVASPDAGADAFDAAVDVGCGVSFPQEGAWVDVEIVQQVIPAGSGGNIQKGTYALTAYRSYLSGPSGSAQVRETLVVTGNATAGAFASNSEIQKATGEFTNQPAHGEASTYDADSNTTAIFLHDKCPLQLETGGNFNATATTLTILGGDRAIERVYTLIH